MWRHQNSEFKTSIMRSIFGLNNNILDLFLFAIISFFIYVLVRNKFIIFSLIKLPFLNSSRFLCPSFWFSIFSMRKEDKKALHFIYHFQVSMYNVQEHGSTFQQQLLEETAMKSTLHQKESYNHKSFSSAVSRIAEL